jgi:hypothetical protein
VPTTQQSQDANAASRTSLAAELRASSPQEAALRIGIEAPARAAEVSSQPGHGPDILAAFDAATQISGGAALSR